MLGSVSHGWFCLSWMPHKHKLRRNQGPASWGVRVSVFPRSRAEYGPEHKNKANEIRMLLHFRQVLVSNPQYAVYVPQEHG